MKKLKEDAPANSVGGGNIAGLGVGPKGEPGLTPKQMKKHKGRVLRRKPLVVGGAPDKLIGELKQVRRNKGSVLEHYLRHHELPHDIDDAPVILESVSGMRIVLKFN